MLKCIALCVVGQICDVAPKNNALGMLWDNFDIYLNLLLDDCDLVRWWQSNRRNSTKQVHHVLGMRVYCVCCRRTYIMIKLAPELKNLVCANTVLLNIIQFQSKPLISGLPSRLRAAVMSSAAVVLIGCTTSMVFFCLFVCLFVCLLHLLHKRGFLCFSVEVFLCTNLMQQRHIDNTAHPMWAS